MGHQGTRGQGQVSSWREFKGRWSHKFNAGTQTHTSAAKVSLSGRIHSKQFIQCEGRPSLFQFFVSLTQTHMMNSYRPHMTSERNTTDDE